jgi:hypothetical protein
MATPEIMAFRMGAALQQRQAVSEMIRQGTKAGSPVVRSIRRATPEYTGTQIPNTYAAPTPFFQTRDESHLPFRSQLVGGKVITNAKTARLLLDNLKSYTENVAALKEGLPPTAAPEIGLTQQDAQLIELNQLVNRIQVQSNQAGIPVNLPADVSLLIRKVVEVSPVLSKTDIQDLIETLDAINILLFDKEASLQEVGLFGMTGISRQLDQVGVREIKSQVERIVNFLTELLSVVSRGIEDPRQKQVIITSLAKKYFGLAKRKVNVPRARMAQAEDVELSTVPQPPADKDRDTSGTVRRPRMLQKVEPAPAAPAAPVSAPRRRGPPIGRPGAAAPAAPRRPVVPPPRVPISDTEYENLRTAYRTGDLDTLIDWIRSNTRITQEIKRKDKAARFILEYSNRNIK